MRIRIPDQGAAYLEGRMQPFVRVECDGIGPRDTAHQRLAFGRYRQQCANAAIHVQPQALLCAEVGNRLQIVDRAGIDRAGGCDHAGRLEP